MPNTQPSSEAVPIDFEKPERLGQLLKQVRWVTRISVALSTAANPEDIYSVLIAGLLSPMGFSYSHVMHFEVCNAEGIIKGKDSCGFDSLEHMEALRDDLNRDAKYLENRRIELSQKAQSEDLEALNELQILDMGSQWVTVFQQLGTESKGSGGVQGMRFPYFQKNCTDDKEPLFPFLAKFRHPFLLSKENAHRYYIPHDLLELLEDETVFIPVIINGEMISVLILDRRITKTPITHDDLEALDWYATQGCLSLQNARLISDLGNANNELKAVDSLKSNFLSIISHELRTPLTAITGFVELVLNSKVGEINPSQRNLLTRVAKNTGHLNNMVNDLIEIAEIEAEGVTDIKLAPIDPLITLMAMQSKLEYRRRDHKVNVQPVFINGSEVPLIVCDSNALERIFFHLLDNAVKFSEEEEVVRVEFEQRQNNRLAISICDTGYGIPEDKLQRIFEQFYQVDNTLTRSHEGLGLGLAVTKLLVQSTHGEITVKSEVGKGSRFTVIYPIAQGRRETDPDLFTPSNN